MRKRVGAAFFLSCLLPLTAVVVWMLRIAGPSSRSAAIAIYLLGLGALGFAVWKHELSRNRAGRGARTVASWFGENRGPFVAVFIFAAAGWTLAVLLPPGRAELISEPSKDLPARLDRDARQLALSGSALLRVADGNRDLFGNAVSAVDPDRKAMLIRTWAAFLDHAIALDRLVSTHQYFYRISPVEHLDLNVRSFLVGYAALVAELQGASRLVRAVGGVRDVESALDEPRPELGVPARSYFRLKQRLIAPETAVRFHAGRAHLEVLSRASRFRTEDTELLDRTRGAYSEVSEYVVKGSGVLLDNPADFLERTAFVAWFPMQKEISEAMGDIRTTDRLPFVDPESIRDLARKVEPGDVVLERRNWYLSNIGLPGFWPHAALYIGTLAEQDAYFGDDARKATQGEAPSAYVGRAFPKVHAAFSAPIGHEPPRVIEAVSEGVTLTSLEHSTGADYVTVLRPRLPKEEKLGAILRAYQYFGRPYDFDFDFVTDEAIVCSELVYKAYRTREGAAGLRFDLVRTADRWVLPPNDIIRKFDEEFGTPKADFDFVAFLDGSEHDHRAVSRDALALRETWRRPKWDILQR